jgi:hypothetical protein
MTNYQIIKFNENTGSIIVQYKNNDEVFATYNVDIPLNENNNFITGDELDSYILGMFPTAVLSRMEALKTGISNSADIHALVIPLPPVVENTPIETIPTENTI